MAVEWPKMTSSDGKGASLSDAFANAVTGILLGSPGNTESLMAQGMSTRITTNVLNGLEGVGRILES